MDLVVEAMKRHISSGSLQGMEGLLKTYPSLIRRTHGMGDLGTWLHGAVMSKQTHLFAPLVNRGFSSNVRTGEIRPLGISVDALNGDGKTPLQLAVEVSDLESVEALLKLGSDPEILLRGRNSLHRAATYAGSKAPDLCRLLLAYGKPSLLESRGDDQTALYIAVKLGRTENVRALLEAGANVGTVCMGKTPLEAAQEHPETLCLLQAWTSAHKAHDAIEAVGKLVAENEVPLRSLS